MHVHAYWFMTGYQFTTKLFWQLTFARIVLFNFDLVGFSAAGCLLFLFTFTLSDLAVLLYLCELATSIHGKVFSTKFVKRKDFPPGEAWRVENYAYYPTGFAMYTESIELTA